MVVKRVFMVGCFLAMVLILGSCGKSPVPKGSSAEAIQGNPEMSAPLPAAPGTVAPDTVAPEASNEGSASPGVKPEVPTAAAVPQTAKARKIGEIVYLEGDVRIHRAGAILKGDQVVIGSVVENFDVIITGARSKAELEIGAGRSGGASVKLSENTSFYYESALLDASARKTSIQLLAGSLALKVEKLSGGNFRVGTDTAVLGVRGTVFIVNTVPDGQILVSCAEGKVECAADDGSSAMAEPGTAVERRDGSLAAVSVSVAALQGFRTTWVSERAAEFGKKAPAIVSAYAERLTTGRPAFDTAYSKLVKLDAIFKTWEAAQAKAYQVRMTDWLPEKKQVGAALMDCLKALFAIERPYYRLVELSAWNASGSISGSLKDGSSLEAFFKAFAADATVYAERMSTVRRALYLFKYASGDSPLGQFFAGKAASLGSGALFFED